ncbi:sensor histidine kinase [Dinghuibacter silviterrae]|uniref:sensor histidine kinase n=1 Tax=Dinghuibacter silviterrae TaxID=1539049 RepID=UPI001FE991B7|nr:sensor histidine kinase [Dinghuibacter silviterrae]
MRHILFGLLCLLSITAQAQPAGNVFAHFTEEKGLACDQVQGFCQDAQGYIWIATLCGLQRYDGYRFFTYRQDLHNPDALQTDYVSTVFEDSKRRLWVGTGSESAYLLDRSTGKFYSFNAHCTNKNNLTTGVIKFVEDGRGDIWMLDKTGLLKLNNDTHQFENVNALLGMTGAARPVVLERDPQGNLWLISAAGLTCYDIREHRCYDKAHNPSGLQVFNLRQPVTGLLFDDDRGAWLSTEDTATLYRFDFRENKMQTYPLEVHSNVVNVFGKDHKGHILVSASNEGLIIFDEVSGTFSRMPLDNNDPYGLHGETGNFVNVHTLTDREGNVWLGTDNGIDVLNFRKRYFYYYGTASSDPTEGLLQTPADKDIYVASYSTHGGILRLDSNLRVKKKYFFAKPEDLRNQLWCLYRDENGRIWAPNQDRTIGVLDPSTGRLSIQADSVLKGCIHTLQRDGQGNVWIGHWSKGLLRIDPYTHRSQAFSRPTANLSGPVKNVTTFYLDGDSVIWAGTISQGFLRFDRRKEVFTDAFLFDQKNNASISSNTVTQVLPYNRDTLLLATWGGIDIFDKKTKTFRSLTVKGLTSTYVQALALDRQGRLWASCINGFFRIDVHTGETTAYDAGDGIMYSSFEYRPFLQLADGRFMVAATKGFMVFHPDSIGREEAPPDVTITRFAVYDRGMDIDTFVDHSRPLVLTYLDNNLNIEFSALQYSTPGKMRYYYQLQGVDKGWVTAGKDQTARYNQLESGHYVFMVKCVDRNGVASRGVTLLPIYIVPPFWRTWWFFTGLALLAMAAVFGVARWIDNRKKEKEMLRLTYDRKIAVMEMNTLRAQMNPHFLFNSLNSINTFILKNDQENASDYLTKFSRLVRLILDNSRTEWVTLDNELRALELYIELETLRFDKPFAYAIHVDPAVDRTHVVVPPLIIQPYVENAIWHGLLHRKRAGGRIVIDVWRNGEALMIKIADNGVGRAAAARLESKRDSPYKSHGMKITAERLAVVNEVYKVNAAVSVEDASESGTEVLLTIQYRTHAGINS